MLYSTSKNCSIDNDKISILSLGCNLEFKEIVYEYEPANLYIYLYSNLLGRFHDGLCKFVLFLPSVTLGITCAKTLTESEYSLVAAELSGILDRMPNRQYAFGEEVFDITDYPITQITPTGLYVMKDNNFELFAETPCSLKEFQDNFLEEFLGTKYSAHQLDCLPNYLSYFIYNGAKRVGVLEIECVLVDVNTFVHIKYKEVLYNDV